MDNISSEELLSLHLDSIGWGRFQYFLFLVCGSAWATDMLWIVNVSIIHDDAGMTWHLPDEEKGLMASMFLLGTLLGCYTWGYLGDRFGRMFSFKKTILIASLASFLLAASVNVGCMIVSETIIGFAIGGEIALGGTVFSEFCPPKKSWALTLLATSWCFGGALASFLAMLIAWLGPGSLSLWRWLSIVTGVLLLLCYFLRRKMPESPRYLLYAEHVHQAEDCLRYVMRFNKVNPLDTLELSLETHAKGEEPVTKDREPLVAHEKDNLLLVLFSDRYMRVSVLLSLIYFLAIGACIALIEFMPEILERTGQEALTSGSFKYETMMFQQLSGIPSILVSTWLVETCFGRKWTIALPFCASAVFAYAFVYAENPFAVTLIQILTFSSLNNSFSMMGFSALYTITPESYKTEIRNLGVGYANALGKLGAILGPAALGLLMSVKHGEAIGLITISLIFLSVGFLSVLLPETRGRPLS